MRLTPRTWTLALLLPTAMLLTAAGQADKPNKSAAGPRISAAQNQRAYSVALKMHIEYCQQWLDDADYKSLQATVSSLRVVAELAGNPVLTAKDTETEKQPASTEETWQDLCGKIAADCRIMRSAIAKENRKGCQQILDRLRRYQMELAKLPAGQKVAGGRKKHFKMTGLRAWMEVLDGVYADAKTSLSSGDSQVAQDFGLIIADVADQLTHRRSNPDWRRDSQQLARAARRLAVDKITTAKQLRERYKEVYKNCRSCHDRR